MPGECCNQLAVLFIDGCAQITLATIRFDTVGQARSGSPPGNLRAPSQFVEHRQNKYLAAHICRNRITGQANQRYALK